MNDHEWACVRIRIDQLREARQAVHALRVDLIYANEMRAFEIAQRRYEELTDQTLALIDLLGDSK